VARHGAAQHSALPPLPPGLSPPFLYKTARRLAWQMIYTKFLQGGEVQPEWLAASTAWEPVC
jgi:hypothetical protein